MIDKILELLEKVFLRPWIATLVGICGAVLFFAVFLCLACFAGDFVRGKKAVKLIAMGQIEEGLSKIKRLVAGCDNGRGDLSPRAIDYEKTIKRPYSYSIIKKLPKITYAGALLFAVLVSLGLMLGANATKYVFLSLVLMQLTSLGLYTAAIIISGKALKNANKSFDKAEALLGNIAVQPADDKAEEQFVLPAEVMSLCARIEEVALEGGADHSVLSRLYSEIKRLQKKADNPAVEAKLAAALEVLSVLIDSALEA